MKAALLRRFEGPGALEVGEAPTPEPGPGEVLLAVCAASVNRTLDMAIMTGRWPVRPPLPHVPGVDAAGVVVAVGPGVQDWSEGDRAAAGSARCGGCAPCLEGRTEACERVTTLGMGPWGGFASHVVVPVNGLHRVPDGVSWTDALSAARHGALALHMLRRKASLRAGECVLVTGAAGGLGPAVVQVAVSLGAEVIAAAGAGRATAARDWGATRTIGYDALPSLRNQIDVAVELTGEPETWDAAFATLRREGRLVGSAGAPGALASVDLGRLYTQRLMVAGAPLGRSADGDDAMAMAADGRLRAPVAARFPLERIHDAYAQVADRTARTVGKIVIELGDLG